NVIYSFLVLLLCSVTTSALADESKIGNFNFAYPYLVSPAYISNHVGFSQQFVFTEIKERKNKMLGITFGERLTMDMKIHDKIGLFASFQGSINGGGSFDNKLGRKDFSAE